MRNIKQFEKYSYDKMAEHWTLQDTSIITDATPQQRTQLINHFQYENSWTTWWYLVCWSGNVSADWSWTSAADKERTCKAELTLMFVIFPAHFSFLVHPFSTFLMHCCRFHPRQMYSIVDRLSVKYWSIEESQPYAEVLNEWIVYWKIGHPGSMQTLMSAHTNNLITVSIIVYTSKLTESSLR